MDVVDFITSDCRRGLFPLRSTVFFAKLGKAALRKFIYDEILNVKDAETCFLQCPTAFALKDKVHLRRTLVFDPIAAFFLYDFVIHNRKHFRAKALSERQVYGYTFKGTEPADAFSDYHRFRKRKYALKRKYRYFVKVDIANCFNSFYHHDVVEAMESNIGLQESQEFGQFLREINAGSSVNCFPQGLYPAKVIGNWFLTFIENSRQLKSAAIIRFIDDVFLFSNKMPRLHEDVLILQHILSNHSLSLNSEKTQFGSRMADFQEREFDKTKKTLLRKRERRSAYDEEGAEDELVELDDDEVEYCRDLIARKNVPEEDVELALSLVRDDPEIQMTLASLVLEGFPHLLKPLYAMVPEINGHDSELWDMLSDKLEQKVLTEYELFWLTRIALDHYEFSSLLVDFLFKVFEHPSSSGVVRAAILECKEMTHGLEDLKVESLRQEPTTLAGIAAVVGLRKMGKGKRNQLYKYAAKTSKHMALLCNIMSAT